MNPWLKRTLWIFLAALVGLAAVRVFRPQSVLVDVTEVRRDELVVTVDDDGYTRVRERYTISAPTDGRLLRSPLDPGSEVCARTTVVAEFESLPPPLLNARTQAETRARVDRARAALEEARAHAERAEADNRYAKADLERRRELLREGTGIRLEFERAERDERRASEDLRAARSAVRIAEHEIEMAEAGLIEDLSEGSPASRRFQLTAPIDGWVLRVHEESGRAVTLGTPLLDIGDTTHLEVVADFLSQEAVKIRAGMSVLVRGFGVESPGGEERVLRGEVRLVEPSGFTKVSALGVEEQRVLVLVDPLEPLDGWRDLRDGYRVELSVVIWKSEDVLVVPTGALFRQGEDWSVFVSERGLARRRTVALGRNNGLEAEVREGLHEGDRVVLYPSELIEEGTRLEIR